MSRAVNKSLAWGWRVSVFSLTLFFFSNVAVHGFLYQGWAVRPSVIFGVAAAIVCPLIYSRAGLSVLATPVAHWCGCFVAVAALWFIAYGGDALPSVLGRCYAAVFLLFFFALFSLSEDLVRVARLALACGVVLAAVCNVVEVLNPTAFLPAGFFYGRAAGFYINPNQAGAAVVLGTVLGVSVVPSSVRWLFLAISIGAIALTLSRAAVLGWCVVVAVLVATRMLSLRTVFGGVAAVAAAAYGAWMLLADYLLRNQGVNLDLLLERVGFFTAASAIPDASQLERATVAEKALLMFEDSLLVGNGLGSTEIWSESASTHNMYLYFMADYGLVGLVLYPALVLLATRGDNGLARRYATAFACFALVWGMFSHNIVGELYSLISFALIAAWVRASPSAAVLVVRKPKHD